MDTKKILIVDDNIQLSQIFDFILKKEGYEILCINEGIAARDGVVSFSPDVIILDIMMEPLNGWDILIQIRGLKDLKKTPIIMLTGKPLSFEEILTYGEMIDGYIVKPVEKKDLVRIVQELFDLFDSITRQIRELQAANKDSNTITQYFRLEREKRSLTSLLARINMQYASVVDEELRMSIEENKKHIMNKIEEKDLKIQELKKKLA